MNLRFQKFLSCLFFLAAVPVFAQPDLGEAVPGQVVIRIKTGRRVGTLSKIHMRLGSRVLQHFSQPAGLELIQLAQNVSIEAAIKTYRADPSVYYAEPNYIYHASTIPNDPKFSEQWGLNNTGTPTGTADVDVNAPEAWDITKGDASVVIGIIDTGVDYSHRDLVDNMWQNPGEIPDNGIDDDNNGFIDDIHGVNVIDDTGNPMDDNGHGTHVAGIIGARCDNGIGVCGINQITTIAACKFLDAGGSGDTIGAINCLNYFANLSKRQDKPVKIVGTNNSWGGGSFSQALKDAIQVHQSAGILFFAAAGNEGSNNDGFQSFPSSTKLSNVVAVAAHENNDTLASFSNYGLHSVHVAAPGRNVYSTYAGDTYRILSGTSMATPFVAGLAGLIKAQNPNADWITIKNLILTSGVPTPGAEKTISGCRIRAADTNGAGALTCVNQTLFKRIAPQGNSVNVSVGQALSLEVLSLNCGSAVGPVNVQVSGESQFDLADDGQGADQVANDGVFLGSWTPTAGGTYTLTLNNGDSISVDVLDTPSWKKYRGQQGVNTYYRDASGGTELSVGDESLRTIPLDFPIHFANDATGFTKLNITSNGTLSFTDSAVTWKNTALPTKEFNSFIAPFWDDLTGGAGGGVRYAVLGTAPTRELVVEWHDIPHFASTTPFTFEVVFFEDKSDILFNYKNVSSSESNYKNGVSATVGIQVTQELFEQFSFNTASLQDGTTILWTTNPPPAPTPAPEPPAPTPAPEPTPTPTPSPTPTP